jgi:hypothetical protein
MGRIILEVTLRSMETTDRDSAPARIEMENESYRLNRKANKSIDTRFGPISVQRWFYQANTAGVPGIAPLDVRLGLIAGRMTPAVAEVTGRLVADMPQQATLEILRERFGITPGVGTLRRVVEDLGQRVRVHHDQVAIDKLVQLVGNARQSKGPWKPLLQVGRDGVFVQTRPFWEEASCGTLAVYDRQRNRLGTVYLGQMPESDQPTMTSRLTHVITQTLTQLGDYVPELRYVTDAGSHPQAFYRDVLEPMVHPVTDQPLSWSWGVDFYHACEYVSSLANSLFGSGEKASAWAEKQRRTMRDKPNGVQRVISRAAQQKRRHGLRGSKKDFESAIGYLKKYRKYMDFAERRAAGEPIGSGITEAGCKVIFNQRMKQSGMRWRGASGQRIVDLRTAVRGHLWPMIWTRILDDSAPLPSIARRDLAQQGDNCRKKPLPR